MVDVEKQYMFHILSVCLEHKLSSKQNACVVLYCHLWPVRLYIVVLHRHIICTFLGKKNKVLNIQFLL
jgi:hypothetical protein